MVAAYKRIASALARGRDASALWAVGAFQPLTKGQNGGVELAPFLTQAFGNTGSTGLVELFNAAFRIAIAIGAILAVVRLVYAGFIYMSTDMFGVKNNAKEIIWSALTGLLLLLSIWIILNQINPDILNLDLLRSASGYDSVGTPINTGTGLGPR